MLNVKFRRFKRSGELEARLREVGERLKRCEPRLTRCHISVIGTDTGDGSVTVKIHVGVPGAEIHADSTEAGGSGQGDVFLALRTAYDNACGQLRGLQREGGRRGALSGVLG